MANPIGEAFITLRPDLSKFSGEAGAAMQSSLSRMGGAFTNVGRALTMGLTAPIVAFGVIGTKAAMDFESAFVSMSNKVEGTPEQLQAIADGALAMSESMPISATAILDIAKNAGQLGIATDDVLGFSKTVAQMAQISDMSAEAIASGMAKIANVMGETGAEAFEKMGNTIAAMGKIGASTEDQIIEMAQRIAGAGAVVGLSTADVLAFSNALATVGIDAEAGGTAISRLFIEMNNAASGLQPTAEQLQSIADGQNAVRDSGYALESANRAVRDANEAVADSHRGVRDAVDGIHSANQDLADAYADLASAQRDQTQASFDARRETLNTAQAQQSLNEIVSKAPSLALQQKEAQMAVAEATERLNQARAKGNAREAQRAELNLAQAHQRLNELLVSQRGYALDVQSAHLGVMEAQRREGTAATNAANAVITARKGVTDATKKQEDAYDRLTDAQKRQRNSEESRLDAQRNVVRANEAYFASQRKLADIQDEVTGKLGIFAKVAGVSAEQFAKKFKEDAAGATTDFIEGIQRLSKEGVNVFPILQKLGLDDARLQRSILGLAGMTGAENDLRAMLEKSAAAWDHGNELQKQNDAINKTTAAQLEMTKNQIINTAAAFGKEFLPMLRDFLRDAKPVIEDIRGLARSFAELDPNVKKAIVVFALLVAAVGPLMIIVGQFMIALGALIFIAPGVAAALGPITLVVLALTAAVLAGYLIWKNWDKIKAIVNSVAQAIIGALNSVLNFLRNNWKTVATLLSGPFAPIVALATDAFGIRTALVGAFNFVLNFITSNWRAIGNLIILPFKDEIEAAKKLFGLLPALQGAFNAVLEFLTNKWKSISTLITAPFGLVVDAAKSAFGIRTAIGEAFANAGSWLISAGKNVINGFINGIKEKLPNLKNLLKDVTNLIPKLKGPPEVDRALLEPSGQMVMDGFKRGLETGWGSVQRQLAGYTDQIAPDWTTDWTAPKLGAGIRAMSGGGGGDSARGEAALASGITVNNYGPIKASTGGNATLRNVGWGVATELQRRGVYS